MKCPICPESILAVTTRQGIEIDYCPTCRGVWLDRGELDKLIDLSANTTRDTAAAFGRPPSSRQPDFDDSDFGRKHARQRSSSKSWLSDLFD